MQLKTAVNINLTVLEEKNAEGKEGYYLQGYLGLPVLQEKVGIHQVHEQQVS